MSTEDRRKHLHRMTGRRLLSKSMTVQITYVSGNAAVEALLVQLLNIAASSIGPILAVHAETYGDRSYFYGSHLVRFLQAVSMITFQVCFLKVVNGTSISEGLWYLPWKCNEKCDACIQCGSAGYGRNCV